IARIGETREPCGMPLTTAIISSICPSKQTAARRLDRNDATHRISGRGRFFWRSTERRRE
ncbi:hypothetical protein BKA93DRAFT_741007, partial [Sparassis latifolia]